MSEKRISYLNRTFDDFRSALIEYSKKYYPDTFIDFDDASIASWLIDINADAADALSYHIDRVYQETNINSAQQPNSLFNLARNNGFKIPGPKGAIAEVRFSCYLPGSSTEATKVDEPDWSYAPVIKRGTMVGSSTQNFELLYDVNFGEAFDDNGVSDRTITPVFDSNGFISKYKITKLAVVVAGESRIYKQTINARDIKPFMEILLPVENVMNIESVLMKDGNSLQAYPSYGEFYMPDETSERYKTTTRFFEVDNLAQQNRWGDSIENFKPVTYKYGYKVNGEIYPTCAVTKGEWKPLKHKFMTEYTDNGYMKVIFGAGFNSRTMGQDISDASDFAKYQMMRTINNDSLGVLPNPGTTIFILYRTGGGSASNLAKGAIKAISVLNIEMKPTTNSDEAQKNADIKSSISVESTTPSVSGKDMPTPDELRYMIKYNSGAQERCVTTKDYINRVLEMPARYGTPFRIGAAEDNNKIMLYLLGIDYQGKLEAVLPSVLVDNIQNYLSEYRMINDFVEIKSGKIINLSFEIDAYIDKNYNKADVVTNIINTVKDYMDINKHQMGDDIFIGDVEKEISKVDGVLNLIDVRVYNECDGVKYSSTQTSQEIVVETDCVMEGETTATPNRLRIDLDASDGIIYSEGDTMLEIKYDTDIKIKIKER